MIFNYNKLVRDKIVDAVYANKFPDGVTFDSTIDSLK